MTSRTATSDRYQVIYAPYFSVFILLIVILLIPRAVSIWSSPAGISFPHNLLSSMSRTFQRVDPLEDTSVSGAPCWSFRSAPSEDIIFPAVSWNNTYAVSLSPNGPRESSVDVWTFYWRLALHVHSIIVRHCTSFTRVTPASFGSAPLKSKIQPDMRECIQASILTRRSRYSYTLYQGRQRNKNHS